MNTFDNLIIGLDQPQPLVDKFLYTGTLALLRARDGDGRHAPLTEVALGWSLAVAALGFPWRGHHIPRERKVLYIATEGAEALASHLNAALWDSGDNVHPAAVGDWLHILPEPLLLDYARDVADLKRRTAEQDYGLIVFDPVASCTRAAVDILPTLLDLARTTGATILAVGDTFDERWRSAAWTDLQVERWPDRGAPLTEVRCAKHRDAPSGHQFQWRNERSHR